jgi:hypothetical protein
MAARLAELNTLISARTATRPKPPKGKAKVLPDLELEALLRERDALNEKLEEESEHFIHVQA